MSPTVDVGKRIGALRALEAALLKIGTADRVQIDSHVLNRAAQLLGGRGAATVA